MKHIDVDTLPPSSLLDDSQTAAILSVKPSTLSVWRSTGRVNLPFVKVGRLVRYKAGDIRIFIEKRTQSHTGEVIS